MSNKVYSATWQATVNAGISFASNFSIQSVGREIKIRSVLISWSIYDTVALNHPNWQSTNLHSIRLTFADTGPLIANIFNITSGPPYAQGNIIQLNTPGQYNFNTFFVSNEVLLLLQMNNSSAVQALYDCTIIIETEEKIIYP